MAPRVTGSLAGPLTLLILSAALLAAAPMVVSESYSWIEHTTSESAGQLVNGSWMGRSGLLCFGFAVLWLARCRSPMWGPLGTFVHRVFGVSMVATAVFASRSWLAAAPYDRTEDLLHSVASFGVGASFTLGVLLVGMRRARTTGTPRWFDLAAFVLAPVLSLAMLMAPDIEGLLQRMMFTIAYVWFGSEALRRDSAVVRTSPARSSGRR